MKKLIAWLLLVWMCAAALAEDAPYEQYLHYTTTQEGIVIHFVSGRHTRFEIPEHIGGVPVVGLSDYCFADHGELETLVIPASVTEISGRAFQNTSDVTFVVEPGSEAENYAIVFDYKYTYADWPGSAPLKSMAAGEGWTVGLRANGTVLVAGGEWDLSGWTDVMDIAAGDCPVGVKGDGTVICADGTNLNWMNVTEVDVCGGHIAALRSDGTVYSTKGYGSTWTYIAQVIAADDGLVGIRKDGAVVAEGANVNGEQTAAGWTGVRQLAVGGRHLAALRADTTLTAVGDNANGQCNTEDWIDIIAVDACGDYTAAVRMDGAVLVAGESPEWLKGAAAWTDVVGISAAAGHLVALKEDGSAVAIGADADSAMCDVGGWFVPAGKETEPTPEPTAVSTPEPVPERTAEPEPEPTVEPTAEPGAEEAEATATPVPTPMALESGQGIVVALTNVNMRADAGVKSDSVGKFLEGDYAVHLGDVRQDEKGADWYRILYGGAEGWVHSGYVRVIAQWK